MKNLAAIAALIFSTGQLFASQPASPALSPTTAESAVTKNEKVEPVIPGIVVARKNGTFLGVEVVEGKFKLSFYDKNKKPMAPDVPHALARWPDPHGPGNITSPLTSNGTALIGTKFVRAPYDWYLHLALITDDSDDETHAAEIYDFKFKA